MKKYAAFDIGNVLVHVNLKIIINKLLELKLFVDESSAWHFLETVQPLQDLGITTISKFLHSYKNISKDIQLEITDTWNKTLTADDKMIRIMETLYTNEVDIALLSNIGVEHAEYLRKNISEIFTYSRVHHLSYEVGARKPTKLYYQSFILEHSEYKNCIYFDDLVDNINASSRYLNGRFFEIKNVNGPNSKDYVEEMYSLCGI
jgi:FMN phosphatase YigB (HAD superfamily)